MSATGLAGAAILAATLCIFGGTGAWARPASVNAHIPVGTKFFTDNVTDQNVTIFTPTANTKGINLRSVVMSCTGVSSLFATGPKGRGGLIALCVSESGHYSGSQAYGLYLPPGWGLQWNVTAAGSMYITYD